MYACGQIMLSRFKHLGSHAAVAVLALLWCVGAAAAAPAAALDAGEAKARLAAVRARIAELAARRSAELTERDAQGARLRQIELDITGRRQALDAAQAAVGAAEARRAQLRTEQSRAQARLDAERATLAAEARAAAMMGRAQQIKLLLNQSDARRLGRMLAYEAYFAAARAAALNAIAAQLVHIGELTAAIGQQTERLHELAAENRRQLGALLQARTERATLLAGLARQVHSVTQELTRLKREEQAVESLLADLERVLQDFPTDKEQNFEQLRGKLPWPVAGRVKARYHELRADAPQGGLRWNGLLIEAARGSKVRAPYFGRVVYADWLQGLGLLLIISHSGGYLSLYGHAEVLYKSVGDWVAPGDVIAALPDSPGDTAPFYFEIRQGRRPVDPKLWLR